MNVPETIAALPVFIASVIGSAHCVGMCGGFVAIYSQNSRHSFIPHALYNLGRLTTYLTLGILAALLGQTVDAISGVARISAIVVGVWLVIFGLLALFDRGQKVFSTLQTRAGKLLATLLAPVFNLNGRGKPFFIGLLTTFLPCGWLYAFVALAAGTADVTSAAMIMTFFWLGSVPALFGLGLASGALTALFSVRMPKVTALLLVMSGILSLSFHLAHSHHDHDHHQHHHHETSVSSSAAEDTSN